MLAGAFTSLTARADDGPKVVKSRVYMRTYQTWHTWSPTAKKFIPDTTAWMPYLKFSVLGPVPSGSQFVVDFTKPGGVPWWSLELNTDELKAGGRETYETARKDSEADEKKYITATGVFGFKIRCKNELAGTNQVLFTGTYKVERISKFNGTPVTKNQADYYVNQDWMLPVGYLYEKPDNVLPPLAAAMWFKGNMDGVDLAGYLFYNGKQIASTKDGGSFATAEEELNTNHNDRGDPTWQLWDAEWDSVALAPFNGEENPRVFYLSKNPGNYEIKVLRAGKLSRDATFTVGADGKVVDNGLGTANNVNTLRWILPVKILGTGDGTWNKEAWRTETFYGNPMKGFAAP